MNPRRAQALAERQRGLVQRSGLLRDSLHVQLRGVHQPLAWADRAVAAWRWGLLHPQWVAGAGLVLVVLRPRRAVRWGWGLWWAWRRWQAVQAMLSQRG